MQQHYDVCGMPMKAYLIARLTEIQRLGSIFPWLYNAVVRNRVTGGILKRILHFAPERAIPTLYKTTLKHWLGRYRWKNKGTTVGKVFLFADEFTNYMDVEIGIKMIELLDRLGYEVCIPKHVESGRTAISKGMLKVAKKVARKNVLLLKDAVSERIPLVGIEPSCILSFRDEYPDLVGDDLKEETVKLGKNCLLYDEFFTREMHAGRIRAEQFTRKPLKIILHGHCHQKSLASVEPSREMLSLPVNYSVEVIPSGCCGMAGAFGYEKKHYELSMKIGEQVLFPAVRDAGENVCISAPGTSCRQQIKDGTGKQALHPIEVLYEALQV